MKRVTASVVAGIVTATGWAGGGAARGEPVAASPFAEKPSNSYSNYRDQTGQTVYPLWGSVKPEDFGSRVVTFAGTEGMRPIKQVPAAGVHPRIFFTPEDVPALKERSKNTQAGRAGWNNLLCWTNMMKGQYEDSAAYAKHDVWQGGFGGLHGPVPLFRLGVPREKGAAYNHNPLAKQYWETLADGTATDFPRFYWNVFALEAYRCLMEDDAAGAQKLAKAVATALKLDQAKREQERAAKHVTLPPEVPVGGFQLAFTYDFIYRWLSPAQRTAFHDELAAGTWSHDNYGTFNTAEGSRSNWATFSYWLIEVLAIEGEPGFNDLKVKGMYRGWRNLLNYGWFQSGAVYEGEAKDQLGMDGILMFAMREKMYGFENLGRHPYLRAYADQFLPASLNPMLTGFHRYDLLGGSRASGAGATPLDLIGLKYMFPHDKRVDMAYRMGIKDDYSNVPDRPDGYYNGLLFSLIFATDHDTPRSEPGALGVPNTFFCGERALMMTRSSWDPQAMMINLHTRQANGGHPFADRNAIMVAGAGRVWSPNGYASFRTPENSVVDIDGKTQDEHTPGRMVDFVDKPDATFAVGDASYAWDWNWRTLDVPRGYYTAADAKGGRVKVPAGYEPELHTVNDFSFLKLPYAYLNVPQFQAPHWILPTGAIRPVARTVNYPVKRAFRTAGLVRGDHPYALVVDDIQKDDAVHHYDWTLALEPDIQIAQLKKVGDREMDVVLTGSDPDQKKPRAKAALPSTTEDGEVPAGRPMLLVRVLNRTQDAGKPAGDPEIVELPNMADPKKYAPVRRLVIPADAVSPEFKVLLYAYHQGEALPTTTWDAGRGTVAVTFGGATDSVAFTPAASGKTDVAVSRVTGGKPTTLASVNKAVEMLRDGPTAAAGIGAAAR